MTLENLIRIVIEIVDKVMSTEKLNVLGIGFGRENEEKLATAVMNVNSNGKVIFIENTELPADMPDVLFVDYIPFQYVASVALGVCDCPFTKFLSKMIVSGKSVTVLGYDAAIDQHVPESYSKLFDSYYKMLASYGIRFALSDKDVSRTQILKNKRSKVFAGNVLSKKDLSEYANNSAIFVSQSTIVTALANDEAKIRNIQIKKM